MSEPQPASQDKSIRVVIDAVSSVSALLRVPKLATTWLAEHARMSQVVSDLGSGSVLLTIQHADHAFDVLMRSGRTHDDVLVELLDGMARWMKGVLKPRADSWVMGGGLRYNGC